MALEARGILYDDARRQDGSVASAVYFPLFRKADTFPHPQAGFSFVSWARSSAQGPDHVATPDRIGVLCTGQKGIWILGGQPAGSASDEKPRLREVNSRGQGLRGGTSTLSAPPLLGAPVLSARILWPHFMFAHVSWALPLRPATGRMAGVYGRIPQSYKPVMLALLPVLFTVRH